MQTPPYPQRTMSKRRKTFKISFCAADIIPIFFYFYGSGNARHQQQEQPAFFVLCVLNAFLCHPLVCWSTFSCCPRFHLASKSKQGPFQVFRPKAIGGQRALAGGRSVVAEIPPKKLRQGPKAPYHYLWDCSVSSAGGWLMDDLDDVTKGSAKFLRNI